MSLSVPKGTVYHTINDFCDSGSADIKTKYGQKLKPEAKEKDEIKKVASNWCLDMKACWQIQGVTVHGDEDLEEELQNFCKKKTILDYAREQAVRAKAAAHKLSVAPPSPQ